MPNKLQKILDDVSGLTLAELALFAYVLITSYDPETRRFEIEAEQSALLSGGILAALVGEKSTKPRKPPDSPRPAVEPDYALIESLAEPESHRVPDVPVEDTADDAERDLGILEYLRPDAVRYHAEALQDTWLKTDTRDSSQLDDSQRKPIASGYSLPIETWAETANNHWRISSQGQDYYLFSPHFRLTGPDGNELGTSKPHPPQRPVVLVTGEQVDLDGAIHPGGNFTWAEATRNGQRMPESASVVRQIKQAAQAMQDIRARLGNRPITITSWYRPPAVNRSVGGASQSRHLLGDGVDFVVSGIPAPEVLRQLDGWWGARGGLASSARHGFTHIDLRQLRARWAY